MTASRDRAAPVGVVERIWRYPVESTGGELLDRADVDARGAVGDRLFGMRDDVAPAREADVSHFDQLPLSVLTTVTLDWMRSAVPDVPIDERRCVTTSEAQQRLPHYPLVPRTIAKAHDMRLDVLSTVTTHPVGDRLSLL